MRESLANMEGYAIVQKSKTFGYKNLEQMEDKNAFLITSALQHFIVWLVSNHILHFKTYHSQN